MRFPELFKVVPVLNDGDLNAGANLDTDSINMKNFIRATFIIGIQVLDTADVTLYAYSGASDGTCTSALTFHYAFGGAAQASANCDVLAADATSAALVIANATYDNYMLIVEVEAVDMDVATGEPWLTLRFVCGAATGNVQIHAILTPRYTGNLSPTALV